MKDIEEVLQSLKGKEIDLTIVHHVEGMKRSTTGKLLEVTENMIQMELEYKDHWFSRKTKKCIYTCNRNTCSLLSIVELNP